MGMNRHGLLTSEEVVEAEKALQAWFISQEMGPAMATMVMLCLIANQIVMADSTTTDKNGAANAIHLAFDACIISAVEAKQQLDDETKT